MGLINEGGQLAPNQVTWGETNPSSGIPQTVPVLVTASERLGTYHRLLAELLAYFFLHYCRSHTAAAETEQCSLEQTKPLKIH